MTMVTVPLSLFPRETVGGSGANFTFDTSTDVMAIIFQIPATGTISAVHYRVNGVSSPVMTHRVELRTVDATTGLPSAAGTLYGSSTSITVNAATYGAATNYTAAVNATGATAGDIAALVFDLSAFTSGSFTQTQRWGSVFQQTGIFTQAFPYQMTNTAASDVLAACSTNAFALEYGSDTYYPIFGINACVATATVVTNTVSNSGVTRRGNRIRSPIPRRICGIWIDGDLDGDCFLRARLAADDSILATATLDKDIRGIAGSGTQCRLFDAGATFSMAAGADYYALLEGNSATTDAIFSIATVPENAQLDQLDGGKFTYGTSYNSGYSDVSTSRYGIGFVYDQLSDGAGGSDRRSLMTGGIA